MRRRLLLGFIALAACTGESGAGGEGTMPLPSEVRAASETCRALYTCCSEQQPEGAAHRIDCVALVGQGDANCKLALDALAGFGPAQRAKLPASCFSAGAAQ